MGGGPPSYGQIGQIVNVSRAIVVRKLGKSGENKLKKICKIIVKNARK
jgi:hypothetical protein